uniref:Transgelin-2 n=1 Tax=Magallana gigas TaxID=29159 RepID=K1RG91_MAGGI
MAPGPELVRAPFAVRLDYKAKMSEKVRASKSGFGRDVDHKMELSENQEKTQNMGDRAAKSGLGYEVDKKMEANYDREEEAGTPVHIVNWLNQMLEGEHPKCESTDWKSICNYLRDGVALCKLINKLLKQEGRNPVQFQKKVMSPFVAMTNIENFNKGCLEFGLAKEFEFQSGDLWEANSKKVMPCYQGEVTKFLDRD